MIKQSAVKRKLKSNQVILRSFLRFPNPSTAEIMALCGIDLIVLDNEHYPFDGETVEKIARAAGIHGAECMVRVPNTEPARIAQMMDTGICGVVVPHIETREEAMAVVNAVKYAPVGSRGFCPITRAASYGYGLPPMEYAAKANDETSIILMTETKKGLENLDEILSIPEVDAISIGPSDVAASYGYPGGNDRPEIQEAIRQGQKKIVDAGKSLVVQGYSGEAAKRMYDRGGRVITIGSDVQVMTAGFSSLAEEMRQAREQYLLEGGVGV